MVYDVFTTLMNSTQIVTAGFFLGFVGIIIGMVRGITKNDKMWLIGTSMFAWLLALAIPQLIFAGLLFALGATCLIFAFIPLLENMNESNIFILGIIFAIVNLLILIGSGAYAESIGWGANTGEIEQDIYTLIYGQETDLDDNAPVTGLCRPGEQDCSSDWNPGDQDLLVFDILATILAIPLYVGKAIKLASMTIFAPFIVTNVIKGQIPNQFIASLISIFGVLINLLIVYHGIKFILNKRGQS